MSSFGYGGTNGHVIVESVDSLYPFYDHGKRKAEASYDHSSKRPLLLCFSAHDKPTLSRNIQAISDLAADYYTADLAHTLNLHRTKFPHRAFTIVSEGQESKAFAPEALRRAVLPKKQGGIGFIFTGQGVCFFPILCGKTKTDIATIGTVGGYGESRSFAVSHDARHYQQARPCLEQINPQAIFLSD